MSERIKLIITYDRFDPRIQEMLENIIKATSEGLIKVEGDISRTEEIPETPTQKLITVHIAQSSNTPGMLRTIEDKILIACPIEICTMTHDRNEFRWDGELTEYVELELRKMLPESMESNRVTILNILEGDHTVKR